MRSGRLWLTATLLAMAAGGMEAQTVRAQRDLRFREMLPGVPESLTWDNADAARFRIQGARNLEILITLLLPPTMIGPGAPIPLTFASTDAAWGRTNNTSSGTLFDPNLPLIVSFTNRRRIFVWLGGTASPSVSQAPGSYSGTITLTVAYTGNE